MTATSGPGISLMAEFAGLGYYAGIARRDLRHSARRAVDWIADTYGAGRFAFGCVSVAWRYASMSFLLPASVNEVFRVCDCGFDFDGAAADSGVRSVGSGSRHEQLDVGAVCSIRRSRWIAGKF